MNSESENFEQLRRLLALKRHEQPPPRYFVDFSSKVLARIRDEEAGKHRSAAEGAWWQRLWAALEAKPAFAGGFSVAVCAVLVSGMFVSDPPAPTTPSARLAPGLASEPFPRNGDLVTLTTDSNSAALKQIFDSFPIQGIPANYTVPRN